MNSPQSAMTPQEQRIYDAAVEFARTHKKARCAALADPAVYPPEDYPVSVFMAGSAGAGKTEASKELVMKLEASSHGLRILRIDPDEFRNEFPGYDGTNAWLFQRPVSSWVDRILDLAHRQRQSFVLDSTFSDYDRAKANIARCLKNGRKVQVLYVYQDPLLAWEFVQAREATEGRRIPVERFVTQYFGARDVVNRLKGEFGHEIVLDLLIKPHNAQTKLYLSGIDQHEIGQIDSYVPEKYDYASLIARLKSGDA